MTTPRKPKRIHTGEQKYDFGCGYCRCNSVRRCYSRGWGGPDPTVTRFQAVARDGVIAPLPASKPGKPKQSRTERTQIAELETEVARLQSTIVEQAVEPALLRGEVSWVRHEVARFECSRWSAGLDM